MSQFAFPGNEPTYSSQQNTLAAQNAAQARRRNRTSYRCSKCGQPKRGHVCPYQPRVVRAEVPGEQLPETRSVATQVEIDERLVVRHLRLDIQGLPESYGESFGGEDAVTGVAAVAAVPAVPQIPPVASPAAPTPAPPAAPTPAAAAAVPGAPYNPTILDDEAILMSLGEEPEQPAGQPEQPEQSNVGTSS